MLSLLHPTHRTHPVASRGIPWHPVASHSQPAALPPSLAPETVARPKPPLIETAARSAHSHRAVNIRLAQAAAREVRLAEAGAVVGQILRRDHVLDLVGLDEEEVLELEVVAQRTDGAEGSRWCARRPGLGDKAYVGEPEILTEFKGSALTPQQRQWNLTVQHYRGRVEHLIKEIP